MLVEQFEIMDNFFGNYQGVHLLSAFSFQNSIIEDSMSEVGISLDYSAAAMMFFLHLCF